MHHHRTRQDPQDLERAGYDVQPPITNDRRFGPRSSSMALSAGLTVALVVLIVALVFLL